MWSKFSTAKSVATRAPLPVGSSVSNSRALVLNQRTGTPVVGIRPRAEEDVLPETALVGQVLAVELALVERLTKEVTALIAALKGTVVGNVRGRHVDEVGPNQMVSGSEAQKRDNCLPELGLLDTVRDGTVLGTGGIVEEEGELVRRRAGVLGDRRIRAGPVGQQDGNTNA